MYGAERWILALVRYLPGDRVKSWVGVIKDAPDLDAPLCRLVGQLGVASLIFEAHGKLSLAAIGQIRRFIVEHKIDVVHTHGYKSDIIGRLAAIGTSCRTLATPHGWSINAGKKLRVYEALDRLCFMFFDAVAPLSQGLQEGLTGLPGLRRKLHLIQNGVDLSEIDGIGETPEPLRTLRADGRLIIGYIGQLIARKRLDTLIEAFHRVRYRDKHLCIVGDGPMRAALEQLASRLGESERISFFGFREDRVALLKGFDVFVLPSELEGIPRCLMEAMGAGIPVVATDIPGCRELVVAEVTGLLFVPGDVDGLVTQLERVAVDVNLRKYLTLKGRQRVQDEYSAEAMAKKYLALYGMLLERGAAGDSVAGVT